MTDQSPAAANTAGGRPRPEVVLRVLREARGLTQQGWAAWLGYSVATVRRWESGTAVPNAETQATLLAACEAWGLFRTFDQGPLRGVTLTPELLRDLLAEARVGTRHTPEDAPEPELPPTPAVPRHPPPLGETLARAEGAALHNLPAPLTSFVGREHEMQEVQRLLRGSRLVTLLGAGGLGKTRLALKVASALVDSYRHGVWLTELAPIADGALAAAAVASAVGVREQHDRPLLASLIEHLRGRHILLVLDNCEHLIGASAELVEALLLACPDLQVLATSREPLNTPGEITWRVPSLAMPEPDRALPVEQMGQYPAVRLLLDRARASQPDFVLTRQNAAAVAQVCWRLDGMPLALELAAARIKLLSVEEVAHRLDDRFGLLTAGARTALPRQQTLRAAVDWSYDLLSSEERRLLGQLSVFAGGWTVAAAEGVCESDLDVVDGLARLLDKSLVSREPIEGEARFTFLETIRAYARMKLLESGAAPSIRDRHLQWCAAFVEEARPRLVGRTQAVWMARLAREHDNVRAALRWALERGDLDTALRIGGAVWRYWWLRGSFHEGRAWLDEILERSSDATDPVARARVLEGAGLAAFDSGELPLAQERFEQALALRRAVDEPGAIVATLGWLSFVLCERGEDQRGEAMAREALELARERSDAMTQATAAIRVARHLTLMGRGNDFIPELEAAIETVRRVDDVFIVCVGLSVLGDAEHQRGELDRAIRLYAECVRLRREHHMLGTNPSSLFGWAEVLRLQGLLPEAVALSSEGVRLAHDNGVTRDVLLGLRTLGGILVSQGEAERGVRLCAAAERELRELGMYLGAAEDRRMTMALARAEQQLGAASFARVHAAGMQLELDAAVAVALTPAD